MKDHGCLPRAMVDSFDVAVKFTPSPMRSLRVDFKSNADYFLASLSEENSFLMFEEITSRVAWTIRKLSGGAVGNKAIRS